LQRRLHLFVMPVSHIAVILGVPIMHLIPLAIMALG
jgi:hypothetical protein